MVSIPRTAHLGDLGAATFWGTLSTSVAPGEIFTSTPPPYVFDTGNHEQESFNFEEHTDELVFTPPSPNSGICKFPLFLSDGRLQQLTAQLDHAGYSACRDFQKLTQATNAFKPDFPGESAPTKDA